MGSHRLRIAAKRLQSVEKDAARPRICYGCIKVIEGGGAGSGMGRTSHIPTSISGTTPLRDSGRPCACPTMVLMRSVLYARRAKKR